MAQPVAHTEIATWQGEDVRLGRVVEALADLRRRGLRTATRASVTNLVLIARDDDDAEAGCDAVHRLGRRHPGRNIVLLPRPDERPAGIDARVLLHGSVVEGHAVWSEDVHLVVRGGAAAHLDSLVDPLTLPDLPVAMWFVRGRPDPHDPLLRAADTVIVDGATLTAEDAGPLAALASRTVVADLCWESLRPWRQLLAGLFEGPVARAYLAGVTRVEVHGDPWPALLLGGWAVSRLGLASEAVDRIPAPATAIRLVAGHTGATATFEAAPVAGPLGGGAAGAVRATSSLAGPGAWEDRLTLPGDPLAWALGEALTRTGRDRAYGQTLRAAAAIAALGP